MGKELLKKPMKEQIFFVNEKRRMSYENKPQKRSKAKQGPASSAVAVAVACGRELLGRRVVAQQGCQSLGHPAPLSELHAARRGQHTLHPSQDSAAGAARYTQT